MVDLLVRPTDPDKQGRVTHITPRTAGWGHVGFDLYRLKAGQSLLRETGAAEHCLVLVAGSGDVTVGSTTFTGLGGRATPFEDKAPGAVYIPARARYAVTAFAAQAPRADEKYA